MRNKWIAAPYVGWMALFVVAPLIVVLVYAVTRQTPDGSWYVTAENFAGMAGYAAVFGRSFLLAGIATVVCILLGYPMAYFLARERGRLQSMATMLIMLPMWMNFLLRTYSWMFLLERNGLVNKILGSLGFFHLLNGLAGALNGAFGLSLPTNVSYVEFLGTSRRGGAGHGLQLPALHGAAHLLGHHQDRQPGHRGGPGPGGRQRAGVPAGDLPAVPARVLSGVTMVFIPSVSTFVISRLLGGGKSLLLGDLIEMQFLGSAYNPHLGSAISLVMMVIVLVCMGLMNRFGEGEGEAVLL